MRQSPVLRFVLVSGVILLAAIVVGIVFFDLGHRDSSAEGVRLIDDHPLYTAHYDGDTSCAPQAHQQQNQSFACTLFAAYGDGNRAQAVRNALAGRNFDWSHSPTLLLFTRPADGYASVSMVNAEYLGVGPKDTNAVSQIERQLDRAAMLPFDGMNEYGMFVGMAAVPDSTPPNDPAKPTIGSLCAIRLILDHARNIAEATDLLSKYNINFGGGPQIHYLLADATGHSAVVEYQDGAMTVLLADQPWQVATNFYLKSSSEADQQACWRYSGVSAQLSEAKGNISPEQGMGLLSLAAQTSGDYPTQWSALYDLRTGDVNIAMSRNYTNTHSFKLPMR